jgi:hypothetical protein
MMMLVMMATMLVLGLVLEPGNGASSGSGTVPKW